MHEPQTGAVVNIQTNIHTLFHINDLFRLRWDPAVLACLAEQAWHRRGLATTLGHRVGDRVETTSITRSLDRLCLNGLATLEHTRDRRSRLHLYRITDLGRTRLGAYQAIARAYDAHPIAAHRREATGVHTLILIADLFRFRWDPAVLACLAEQPCRNGALARTLGLRVGDRVEDNTLYRSLGRLRRGGLVTAQQIAAAGHNVPIYRITSHGRTLHDLYGAIAAGYPAPPAAQPSTAPATTVDIDWSAAAPPGGVAGPEWTIRAQQTHTELPLPRRGDRLPPDDRITDTVTGQTNHQRVRTAATTTAAGQPPGAALSIGMDRIDTSG
jgi:DNA-binding PadR family transcriptional regulator